MNKPVKKGTRKVNIWESFRKTINSSNYLSRDLSWLKFNERVLDMAKDANRNLFDKLKFLAISASNLDEFFTIRVGILYNYLDYNKRRVDYSGLREHDFRDLLLHETEAFVRQQERVYTYKIWPALEKHGLRILSPAELTTSEQKKVDEYFKHTIFPMLTPMAYDNYRTFPLLKSRTLIFAVITSRKTTGTPMEKISFVQIPKNLKQFYEIHRKGYVGFVPIEDIIRRKIKTLFRNVNVEEMALFRITRNGDLRWKRAMT